MAKVQIDIEEVNDLVSQLNSWAMLINEGFIPEWDEVLHAAHKLEKHVEKAGMTEFVEKHLNSGKSE